MRFGPAAAPAADPDGGRYRRPGGLERKEDAGSRISTSDDWVVSFTAGELRPRNIIAIPFFHEKRVKGVIELGSMEEYTPATWNSSAASVTISVWPFIASKPGSGCRSCSKRRRRKPKSCKSQHGELESLNMELEMQAEKLQVSEEELKVQQEELMQTNQELEERSRSLEEKNQLVLIRNLDIQKKAEELALSTKV